MFHISSPELFLLLFAVEFFVGSLMFSFWLGRAARTDIRNERDRNPGATNLWRVLGWKYGLAGLVLDYAKGFIPLVFIVQMEILSGWQLAVVSVAPVLGHAFSPFLRFSGGKAIAVTFGIWSALTTWEAPVLLGGVFTLFSLKKIIMTPSRSPEGDAVRVIVGMVVLFFYTLFRGIPSLWIVWLLNFLIVLFTHRLEIRMLFSSTGSQK